MTRAEILLPRLTEKYAGWRPLTFKEVGQEYDWEYDKSSSWAGHPWPTEADFRRAVEAGHTMVVDPALDSTIGNRSHSSSLEDLKDLVAGYRYPRDVDRIVRGIKAGDHIPYPIVLKAGGKLRVMSGNTRMDVAFLLGENPTVMVLDVGKK